jgi:hypothetical protein
MIPSVHSKPILSTKPIIKSIRPKIITMLLSS